MTITADNITEVIIGLIALAGEIPKDLSISGISKRTVQNQISKGKKEMLFKVDREHNRIRIRAPKGLDYLKDFSEDLFAHYMMISNCHRFQRSIRAVENLRCHSDAVLCMIRNGYAIDNIRLVHHSNNFGGNEDSAPELMVIRSASGCPELCVDRFVSGGDIISVTDAASSIQPGDKRYYTSKFIKRGFPVTHRINLSGISGVMLCSGNMYSLYYLPEDRTSVSPASEIVMNRRLMEIYESAFGREAADRRELSLPKGSAIVMSRQMIQLPGKQAGLERAFSEYRTVPDNQDGDYVLEILGCGNWKEELQTALYGNMRHSPVCDGVLDGIPSWEFLSCDYSRIPEIKKQNRRVNIICLKWQYPYLAKTFKKTDADIKVLSENQEMILRNYLRGENGS